MRRCMTTPLSTTNSTSAEAERDQQQLYGTSSGGPSCLSGAKPAKDLRRCFDSPSARDGLLASAAPFKLKTFPVLGKSFQFRLDSHVLVTVNAIDFLMGGERRRLCGESGLFRERRTAYGASVQLRGCGEAKNNTQIAAMCYFNKNFT